MKEGIRPDTTGKKRKHVLIKCDNCEKEFWKPKRFYVKNGTNCCSRECVTQFRRKGHFVELECAYCGKEFERAKSNLKGSKSGLHFCSRKCKDKAQRIESGFKEIWPNHFGNGNGYREKALKEYGKGCEICGWNHTYDVHHIDGNRENNNINNLIILCPNCHSLTKSYIKYKLMRTEEKVNEIEDKITETRRSSK